MSEPETDTQGHAATPSSAPRQTSSTAVLATVVLVVFSVFIGVYGPRLGNRQQLPAGTTLVELATAIQPRHAQRVIDAQHTGVGSARQLEGGREGDRESAEQAMSEIVEQAVLLPKLDGFRVRWLAVHRVRFPGGSGAMVFCTISPTGGGTAAALMGEAHASIVVLQDEDRFTTFDGYGRPQPMPEGEVFSVAVREHPERAEVEMFRVGGLIYAVQANDLDVSASMVAELELRAAQSVRSDSPQT